MSIFIYTIFIYPWYKKTSLRVLSVQGKNTASTLEEIIYNGVLNNSYGNIVENSLNILKKNSNIKYIIVSKKDGFSLFHKKEYWREIDTHNNFWNRYETKEIKYKLISYNQKKIFNYTYPLFIQNRLWGWVHIGFSIDNLKKDFISLFDFFLPLIAITLFITILFSFFFAKKIATPIIKLKKSIDKISKGNFKSKVKINSNITEIRELAKNFNLMVENIQQKTTIINRISTIFENTTEAVVVLDREFNIISVNNSFCRIFGFQDYEIINHNFFKKILSMINREQYQEIIGALAKKSKWNGEIEIKNKYNSIYTELLTINKIVDENLEISNYFAIFNDITELKKTQKKLKEMAFYDNLTKLPNRTLLNENLKQIFNSSRRERKRFAILFLDLDNFKYVNDTFGHDIGDELLIVISNRIKTTLRKNDILARIGGDEFVVVLENIKDEHSISIVAKKIINAISKKVSISKHEFFVGVSIGIAIYPTDSTSLVELNKYADLAMYNAKENGKNRYKFFNSKMNLLLQRRHTIERELRKAIKYRELELYLQPQFSLNSNKIDSAEALLRWNNKKLGVISPTEFISIAEESDLILSLGEWVFERAFECSREISHKNRNFKIAINISNYQLNHTGFLNEIHKIIENSDIDTTNIEFEVTESILMDNIEKNLEKIKKLKKMGIEIAIDDFGTGYSSINYLKKLPIHTIKIDKTFIDGIPNDSQNVAITTAIIAMAKKLNLNIVAEGVENYKQFNWLKENACDKIQGYYIAKPLPYSEFANRLV